MRQQEKDRRDGYGQGYADARNFRLGLERQPGHLADMAKAYDFVAQFMMGYHQGYSNGQLPTLRLSVPEPIVEKEEEAA